MTETMGAILAATPGVWARASLAVRRGHLVVFPTDTVYGVGCDPFNEEAIERIYRAKGRSTLKAIPLLLSDMGCLSRVALHFPPDALALGAAFWPGALTLVVPRRPELPAILSGGPTVAVRIPDHAGLRDMIRECGGAIAATSANRSGEPDATDAQIALAYLGASVKLVLDGGVTPGGVPSTVVDCTQQPPRVLRVGTVSVAQLDTVLKQRVEEADVPN